jgi:hypothetical protein
MTQLCWTQGSQVSQGIEASLILTARQRAVGTPGRNVLSKRELGECQALCWFFCLAERYFLLLMVDGWSF